MIAAAGRLASELLLARSVESARGRDLALVAVMCLVLYLAGNGRTDLWDRDEAWYAQTAREMLWRGDFVVPHFNGEPRLRKPVLVYWLMTAAYSVFGDNEFGARFCSAVAGTITCLLTYRLGARMFNRRVGLAAALMLAVSPFMVVESKLATTDAVLTAALMAAMSCLWELHAVGFSWRSSLGFWFLVGVMVLTKGPFGPSFLACGVIVWLMLSRQWATLGRLNWLAGLALVAAICLPWGVAVYVATGGEFYRVAVGDQLLGHALSPMNDHRGFPGFYLALALGGLLPWTLFLPLGLCGVRQWFRGAGPGSFLIGWMVGPLILLEMMRTKLPQYHLPAFPAWALVIARGVIEFHAAGNRLVQAAGVRRAVFAWVAGCLVTATAGAALAVARLPGELRAPSLVAAAVLGVGMTAAAAFAIRLCDRIGWATAVGTWWSLALVVAAWLIPNAAEMRVARAAAEALSERRTSESPVVLFGYREPSLVFYLGRPVPTFGSAKELARFLDQHSSALTLLRDSELQKLRKSPAIAVEPLGQIESHFISGLRPDFVLVARLRLDSTRGATAMQQDDRLQSKQ